MLSYGLDKRHGSDALEDITNDIIPDYVFHVFDHARFLLQCVRKHLFWLKRCLVHISSASYMFYEVAAFDGCFDFRRCNSEIR